MNFVKRFQKKEEQEGDPGVIPGSTFVGVRTGVVKRFNDYSSAGYGFVLDAENNQYFVHHSHIVNQDGHYKNLARGQRVKFKGWDGPKGLYATEVQLILMGGDPREQYKNLKEGDS